MITNKTRYSLREKLLKKGKEEKSDFDEAVVVRSTDYERTLASATVLLSELMDVHDTDTVLDIRYVHCTLLTTSIGPYTTLYSDA